MTVHLGPLWVRTVILTFTLTFLGSLAFPAQAAAPGNWPNTLDINVGQTKELPTPQGPIPLTLLALDETWNPDYWIAGNNSNKTLKEAIATVAIGGIQGRLTLRPHQLPTVIGGLRLYAEANRAMASDPTDPMPDLKSDLRLSWLPAESPWGPDNLLFPIRGYRWRSASYNNTWSALVPYNALYYHKGEDFGAIPDKLEVQAIMDGTVVRTPLPGPLGSNTVGLESPDGIVVSYAHMNIETIDKGLTIGTKVKAGQVLGKTGMTWGGAKQQQIDPHLHISFVRNGSTISCYPFLVDAYIRQYQDPLMAVSGAYYYALPGEAVTLDATRTIAGPGEGVTGYTWKLSNGLTANTPITTVTYDKPGFYTEELEVRGKSGAIDKDFAQVRVYDPKAKQAIAFGWVYHTPVRGIRPGTEVTIWNRLVYTKGSVMVDFGDGSESKRIGQSIKHAYGASGMYTVTFTGVHSNGQPATAKMKIVVE